MTKTFSYGVIGVGGQMQKEYLPELFRRGSIPAFACDLDIDNRDLPSSIARYRSLKEIPPAIDDSIVVITLPHSLYPPTIEYLLHRGYRNLVIEKPAALSLDDFNRVDQLISQKRANVFVLSRRRFVTSYTMLKKVFSYGVDPDIFMINISRTFHKAGFGWRADSAIGGATVLFDLGYHAIDLAFWLCGRLTILATQPGMRPDVFGVGPKRASIRIICAERANPIEIYVDRLSPSPFEQVTVFFEKGSIVCTPNLLAQWDRSTNTGQVFESSVGGEVRRMFDDIERSLLDVSYPRVVSLYSDHKFHIDLASRFELPDHLE